jgi:polyribonucleotide nucleotidyltransferase
VDFLPLTCDYKENTYASGRIPGGFFKREGKPPEKEVLTSRLIDRPIRPLFPAGWRNESQIIALVISADEQNDSDVLAITGASAALALSSIPQSRTIAGVRVGHVDGDFVINPTYEQRKRSTLDLLVAGSKDGIVMVEAGAKEVPEEQMVQALDRAHAAIKDLVAGIDALAAQAGKTKRSPAPKREIAAEFRKEVEDAVLGPLSDAMRIKDKLENYATVDRSSAEYVASLSDEDRRAEGRFEVGGQGPEGADPARRDPRARHAARRAQVRRDPQHHDRGRGAAPRPRILRVQRGETQALVTATLGTADDQQKVESVDGEVWKRFMLHYNFPPFSVGEVKFLRGPGAARSATAPWPSARSRR